MAWCRQVCRGKANQAKSAQAKGLAVTTGLQGVLHCSCGQHILPSAQHEYSPAGTLGSLRAAGDGGGRAPCLLTSRLVALAACNRFRSTARASQCRCAELVTAHLPSLSSAACIDVKIGTRRMAMM